MVDLPDLITLHVLLEEGSVSAAARRLGVVQSSMSHRLARLRERFGDPLLVREGGRMLPTARALELAGPLAESLEALERLVDRPGPFVPATARSTVLLYLPDLLIPVVPPLVAALAEEAPGIELRIRGVPPELSSVLAGAEASLAVVPSHFLGEGLRSRGVGQLQFAVAGRAGHPLFDGALTVERWLGFPHVVVRTGNGAGNLLDAQLRDRGLERRVGLEVPSFLAGLLALAGSDLVMNVPSPFADAALRRMGLVCAPPPIPLASIGLSMAWHERFHRDPAHRWVRERVHGAVVVLA
ncbi:MAG: LysR family transcriptional regulator [Myxococcota bacterium]